MEVSLYAEEQFNNAWEVSKLPVQQRPHDVQENLRPSPNHLEASAGKVLEIIAVFLSKIECV